MSDDPILAIFGSGRLCSEAGSQRIKASKQTLDKADGSCDLFPSQSSQASLINEEIDITLQLTEYVWVQCDNPECQKWRRIPTNEGSRLGEDPWYCHMNSDSQHSTCQAPEEDHAMYDRMAKKAGIKYIMSELNEGSLVWAKIAGYCRWPAIVTKDPDMGVHVWNDVDGDASYYHVEFLGKPHSHSWVPAKQVEVYGHKTGCAIEETQSVSSVDRNRSRKSSRGRGRRQRRKVTMTTQNSGKHRKSYRRMHIDTVLQEADFLLGMTAEERLTYTVFRFDALKQEKLGKRKAEKSTGSFCDSSRHKKRQEIEQDKSWSKMKISKVDKSDKIQKTKGDKSCSIQQKLLQKPDKQMNWVLKEQNVTKKGKLKRKSLIKKGKENAQTEVFLFDSAASDVSENDDELSTDEGISVKTVKTEPSASCFDSPDQFSQSKLKFCNTLADKSKEEKFKIDLDMYRKNEKAFEHDVRRFMSRNGKSIRSSPLWHNVPIQLFQLFLAVHERGGFQKTTADKQWTAVYKELTEQHKPSSGSIAKKYYEANLYPYELYIMGKDYTTVFQAGRKKLVKKPSATNKHTCHSMQSSKNTETLRVLIRDDESSFSQDIEAILVELKGENDPSTEMQETASNKGIKFHDDTTESPSLPKVPSEFLQGSPVENNQLDPKESLADGLSDIEQKILHEMKALESDIQNLDQIEESQC